MANAIDTGFKDRDLLKQVCDDLRVGADIGCREEYRVESTSSIMPLQHMLMERKLVMLSASGPHRDIILVHLKGMKYHLSG